MKITFIGCGNMAKAMIGGILKQGIAGAEDLTATAATEASRQAAEKSFGIHTEADNAAAAADADLLVLAVKPIYLEGVIREIAGAVSPETIIVSLAPGRTLEWMEGLFGRKVKLIRTMPNTPALVGEGMTGLCANSQVGKEDLDKALQVFESFGKVQVVPERLMDTVVGVSGSSPAYVFLFIEALADAAVADGMPRAQAYEFAAQSVLGSAKMVLETGKHPGELKDMVCSPGGTTIEAVRVLEEKGFRSAVIEAAKACVRKSSGM